MAKKESEKPSGEPQTKSPVLELTEKERQIMKSLEGFFEDKEEFLVMTKSYPGEIGRARIEEVYPKSASVKLQHFIDPQNGYCDTEEGEDEGLVEVISVKDIVAVESFVFLNLLDANSHHPLIDELQDHIAKLQKELGRPTAKDEDIAF